MSILFFNSNTLGFEGGRPSDLDYGIRHFGEDGSVLGGMRVENYQPSPPGNFNRIKYLHEFGPNTSREQFHDWRSPTAKEFIGCMVLLRRFILSGRFDRKVILTRLMDFDDTGVALVESSGGDAHAQFIYLYTTEPTQIEIYISADDYGSITEINRYNHSNFKEVKIPLNDIGMKYVFLQIMGDICRVDLNKFDFEEFNLFQLTKERFDILWLCLSSDYLLKNTPKKKTVTPMEKK